MFWTREVLSIPPATSSGLVTGPRTQTVDYQAENEFRRSRANSRTWTLLAECSVPSVNSKARNSLYEGSRLCKGKFKSILEDICADVDSVVSFVRSENKVEPCATWQKGREAQAHHVQLVWATPVGHHCSSPSINLFRPYGHNSKLTEKNPWIDVDSIFDWYNRKISDYICLAGNACFQTAEVPALVPTVQRTKAESVAHAILCLGKKQTTQCSPLQSPELTGVSLFGNDWPALLLTLWKR